MNKHVKWNLFCWDHSFPFSSSLNWIKPALFTVHWLVFGLELAWNSWWQFVKKVWPTYSILSLHIIQPKSLVFSVCSPLDGSPLSDGMISHTLCMWKQNHTDRKKEDSPHKNIPLLPNLSLSSLPPSCSVIRLDTSLSVYILLKFSIS